MEKPLVKNAANQEQLKDADEKIQLRREQELNDLRVVLGLKEGRRFLYRLINKICHVDAEDFHASGSIMCRLNGERNIGRIVKSDAIEADFDRFQLLEKENWPFLRESK